MSEKCCGSGHQFDGTSRDFKRILWIVITINAVMFAVEITAGALAGSKALQADALDFLADSLTYSLSLVVIGMSIRTRSLAALAKAVSLALMGCWVIGSTVWHMMNMTVPQAEVMGAVGVLAFVANMICVLLLIRYKDGDANIRSVWLCSRNDAIGNVAVVISSTGVWSLQSAWPDLIVAMGLASLFLWSALQITRQAFAEMAEHQHA